MRSFDAPDLQLSGLSSESRVESWKRLAAATLMATAALLLCAVLVVILAPLLPHPSTASHAAGLTISLPVNHARV